MAIAYKLFRVLKKNPGAIYPLFVDATNEVPVGEWVEAKEGSITESGKVKSRLGPLCFRPGWHLSDIPLAIHIGERDDDGNIAYMAHNHVWCECEYSDDINYQEEANGNGVVNGKFRPQYAYLKHIPENGYYRYKTSPNMLGNWIISGSIKVLRVLSDEEAADIVRKAGNETNQDLHPLPRKNGPLDLKEFGF